MWNEVNRNGSLHICADCAKEYTLDLMLPKNLWNEITNNNPNLCLCASCIINI